MFALEIPWKLKVKPWVALLVCHQTRGLLPALSGWLNGLVGDSLLLSCLAKAKRRCKATTCEDSQPPSNSVVVWSNSQEVNSSSLTLMRHECWHVLLPFLLLVELVDKLSYINSRNLGVRQVVWREGLLFETNPTAVWLFLFLVHKV